MSQSGNLENFDRPSSLDPVPKLNNPEGSEAIDSMLRTIVQDPRLGREAGQIDHVAQQMRLDEGMMDYVINQLRTGEHNQIVALNEILIAFITADKQIKVQE